jgi:spermidine synthase
VTGTASLGSEIAAARLMAPFFGASTIVWANTIAVVLLALSVGYWFGGRIADRHPHKRDLHLLVLIAAVLLAIVPIVADPFLELSIDAFDDISIGAFAGSLATVLALVAVPILLLGAVAPYAIRLTVADVTRSGEIAGRLYAISTLGSLVGTFLSSLLLIPLIGTQRTFMAFGLALAIVAVAGLDRRFWPLPLIVAAGLALPVGTTKTADDGARVLYEAETSYQYARVIENADGTRELELNEGQATHSQWDRDTVLTDAYWDAFLVEPMAALGRPPRSLAVLGSAAGTMVRAYGRFFASTTVDAVEIDGELTDIGKRFFGLRDRPGLRLITADARPFLRRTDRRYDAIFIDAYRQPYIPFYLATKEFFALVRARLNPGGVVVINVGHPEEQTELEQVLSRTLETSFDHVARDPIKDVNTLLLASEQPISGTRLRAATATLDPALRPIADGVASRLEPPLPGGEVYTDDRAPVEWLIDKSIVDYAAD